ncbi:MAG TPA: HAMP domain-containing sensor histidine kinase, partial [Candidatus Lustribacter sp.]|nr:HAMP domain-containing sensor histidine kinase [Candidatus Lustribacter sp.]
HTGLAVRLAVLTVAVAVMTAIIGGAAGVSIISRAGETAAVRALSTIADQAQAAASTGRDPTAAQNRARRALRNVAIQVATVTASADGSADVQGDPLAVRALSAADRQSLLGGADISRVQDLPLGRMLVEARATPAGGLVLAQRRSDAAAITDQGLRRALWALAAATLLAAGLGLWVAWRMTRPLRQTAEAAHALATGHRDVVVPEVGPAEVAEVAQAVNSLSEALTASERRQREFLLSVSHDLRTPLTAIAGYAEALSEGDVDPAQLPAVGRVLATESARLERMVADLLDLARLDAHEVRLDLAPTSLTRFVEDLTAVWQVRCAAAGVPFRAEGLDGDAVPDRILTTDPQRLRQGVDALLENALRLSPEGAPIVLAAGLGAGRRGVAIEVRDSGPGLADADLAVAFERSVLFERYRSVRPAGTGLGLAIVHRLVTRLGGTVTAGHAPEGGACFRIELPG